MSAKTVKIVFKTGDQKCFHTKGCFGPLKYYFNPITSICSALIIWAFVAWCIQSPDGSQEVTTRWKSWITKHWTWLYIGTQDVWAVFIICVYFSKYSNMKLGKDDEKPEFSNGAYFTMLFAAGVGIGLFYFGVAEPIFHLQPGQYGNRFWNRYTDNQQAQDAINVTFYHWGIHAWVVYVLIGLLLSFLSYRRSLPMTMRMVFFPLIGERVYGILGDLVDILSIICTMFGVCTSLGLGVVQLNNGLSRVIPSIEISETNQVILIWCITSIATLSVVSGLKFGIRTLSETCFGVGCLLLLIVYLADDTVFLTNLFVQSCGYYLQWIVQIGFHTDAFAMRNDAPDGKENPQWMDSWTLFYWGWWISWAPFVGMFIAKISRGRTIKEFILYTSTLPVIYTFFWLSVFGGAGISMERKAQNLNITCSMYNSTRYPMYGAENIWKTHHVHRLSCRTSSQMWFDVVEQYEGIGNLLSIISIIGLILYFITSSDSGSLVIDSLSANGYPDPPIGQRIFWAVTEGATATALLRQGGKDALRALQAVSIAAGLPFTIILNFACISLWRAMKMEYGDIKEEADGWKSSLLTPIDSIKGVKKIILNLFFPWYTLSKAVVKLDSLSSSGNRSKSKESFISCASLCFMFNGWIILLVLEFYLQNISYVGWSLFVFFLVHATKIRIQIREFYHLEGTLYEDFLITLLYPFTCVQIENQLKISNDSIEL
uniref:BCCT family transporter n=1 Tax=Clytia hemisphaerica TaxID=252671 RepID=A0A7M5VCE0_9CNID